MAGSADRKTSLLPENESPLVLVGPPRDLRGELQVRNTSDRKVIVRQPRLKAAPRRGRGAAARRQVLPDTTLSLRRIVVRAGQSRPVPLSIALDPTTPPGTYEAELEIDGEERQVLVHVTEDVSLVLEPAELVLAHRPGGKVEKQVVFRNTGNVPVTIRSIGTVVLDEELAHCRALRGALADVGDTMKNLDDFVVALGRRYRAIYETLALKVHNEKVTLAPGTTEVVTLTIAVPEKLEPRSRYSGYAAISTGTLAFTLVPE